MGARRSGTYWLQRVVTAHPEVSAVPSETHLLSHGVAPLFERFQHSLRSSSTVGKVYVDREAILDATRDLCDVIFTEFMEAGTSRVAERTPLHVLHLDLIEQIYPDARFVHIVRDGRDVARSIAVQSWGPDSIEEAAAEWRSAIVAARSAGIPEERYREVRYEDLLSDPDRTAADLYRWLDLPAGDEIVEVAASEARISANLGSEPSGVAIEKWRRTLSAADLASFDRVAGDLLAELSYPPSDPAAATATTEATDQPAPAAPSGGGMLRRALARRRRDEPRYRQELVDDLVGALQDGASDRLVALMTEDAVVRIVSPEGPVEGRAERGREILRDFLAADTALQGRQLRGEVFPSLPYTGVLLTHAGADGRPTSQVAFIRLGDDRVRELIVYRL